MALLALGSVVSDIRGSIAGTTYSRNKGGAYARARVAPINRNTPAQTQVRANFGANAKAWSSLLTAGDRAAWTSFAAANPLVNILGASIIVSGLAMYQKLNQVLAQTGNPSIALPPPDLSVPLLGTVGSASAVQATPKIGFTLTNVTGNPGAGYYVFATAPLAGGKTPQQSQLRYIGLFAEPVAAGEIPITTEYIAKFGPWLVGASIGVAVATVNEASGAVTPALQFNIVST